MNLLPIDELNNLTTNLTDNLKDMTEDEVVEEVTDLLLLSYANGVAYANDSLDTSNKAKIEQIQKSLSKTYEGIGYEQKVREYTRNGDITSIIKVADTESHRIFNEATINTAKNSGKEVYKTWITYGDDKVRDAHMILEGVKVPLNEKFYIGEASTYYPGAFGIPDLDINCRCILKLSEK